ncbi:hypothetical protein KKH23_04935 [Patescibacteria group bacterium]|nr:hypothetical protein [Patescibacteria group bacterium]
MPRTRKEKERRRGKRRENRHERRQQQHAGGGEWDCVRIPEGVEVFKPEGGETYHIDVIPYVVGEMNKNADSGDEYFELSYAVYNRLGIDEKKYIAIGEMLGVRDPVMEHFAALRKAGAGWDDMKQFRHQWRQLMLVFVHEQAEKGLQLFEGAYGTFGELLDEEIQGAEEEYIDNFDDPDGGATLVVRFKAKNIGQKHPWVLAAKINFEKRDDGFTADGDEKLAAEILEQAEGICLDASLKIADYAILKAALDGEPTGVAEDDEPEPEEEPEKGRRRGRRAEPEQEEESGPKAKAKSKKNSSAKDLGIEKGDEVEHEEYGVCTVIRVAKDGLTVTIMDEKDTVYKGVDPTDLELSKGLADEPDPEPEKPRAKAQVKKEKSKTKDDDEWDDNWEE